ncbi:MAG: hypothetical protein WB783_04340 [Arenicellales bacterium]|jgi:hypothetical protein
MRRLLIVLLLFPLAASAAEWRYNGQMLTTGVSSAGESAPVAADAGGPLPRTPANAPTNDMSMSKVRQTFGDPQKTWAAVGKPPITRWQYPQYVVYFENDRVITSVSGRL